MFNLEDYETVAERVLRLKKVYADSRILTEVVKLDHERGEVLAKAYVYVGEVLTGSDYAFGIAGTYPVSMRKFYVEDTITSAIGRAISLVIPTDKKPTREDMQKVQQHQQTKNLIEQTRAQMAETAATPPVIAKADDPWTTWETPATTTIEKAIETTKAILGAEELKGAPLCKCGDPAKFSQGQKKTGGMWAKYACPTWNKNAGSKCDFVQWLEVGADGTWVPQKVWS